MILNPLFPGMWLWKEAASTAAEEGMAKVIFLDPEIHWESEIGKWVIKTQENDQAVGG